MKHTKINLMMAGAAIVGLFSLALAPVTLAHNGPHEGAAALHADKAKVQERVLELKTKAKSNLAERRAGKEARTAERRQHVCEQRKKSISNKITAFAKSADNILTRFDAVYVRVKDFKTDKKVDVTNYDELIAAADAKQTAAAEAVAALKELSADFDCTATDPAQTLAAVKAATVDARTALKEYRTSIKHIVVALAQVHKNSGNQQTTGGDGSDAISPATTDPDAATSSPALPEEQ
jgi:hypothetical protein